MKRLALTIALALPQMAGAQSDPFMDLTMPDLGAPAGREEGVPPDGAAVSQTDPFTDLTMPALTDAAEQAEPDRVVNGCTVPGRPAWTSNFPPKERQRGTLLRLMHERLWLSKVTESGSCSCENRWPGWDETERAFNLYMKDLDMDGVTTVYQAISDGNAALNTEANKICAEENT